jgi:hypothetical protein
MVIETNLCRTWAARLISGASRKAYLEDFLSISPKKVMRILRDTGVLDNLNLLHHR